MPARDSASVGTGLRLYFPPGCYGRLASRSGIALHLGIDVAAGVIDADYVGETSAPT